MGRREASSRSRYQGVVSSTKQNSSGVVSHVILNADDKFIPEIRESETNPKPIDSSIKNDDSLVKMAAIVQRIIGASQKAEGDAGFLSNEEKEQLLRELEETVHEVADEQDIRVDELTNEIEELKQKVGK